MNPEYGKAHATQRRAMQRHDYRPEIDGLRAIAVLPVLLFHSGIGPFSGGFVGVDVFFVISGYLITRILWNEIAEGEFSLVRFYERRTRRILPTLYIVLMASTVAAWFLMLPEQLANFGQSIVATVFFSNNVLLTLTAGYWDTSVEFKPLVHTWSLGVEEQYYFGLPLLLLTASAILPRKWIFWVIALIGLLSFALIFPMQSWNSNANFYLLFTRAWELLAGSLIALAPQCRPASFVSQLSSLSGLAMILAATVLLDENVAFPGPTTLLPVVGSAMVILFAVPGTFVYSFLATRLMVTIGLLSYSIYLWHQPLFAFARILAIEEPGGFTFVVAIALTFVLAGLSWRFIEKPFRDKTLISTRAIIASTVISSALLIVVGVLYHATNGFPSRLYGQDSAASDDHISYNERLFRFDVDQFPDQPGTKILIIGNSFGRDFGNMLIEYFDPEHINLVYRDDINECFSADGDLRQRTILTEANIVIIGSGSANETCIADDIEFVRGHGGEVFYAGSKNFGYNLNWIMQIPPEGRSSLFNQPAKGWAVHETKYRASVPEPNFLSIYDAIRNDEEVPVTNQEGKLISADTIHLTRAGARLIGKELFPGSRLESLIKATSKQSSQ